MEDDGNYNQQDDDHDDDHGDDDKSPSPDDIIEINAGGKIITTLRSTLTAVPDTMLANMFSGRWEESMVRDNNGRIFLDEDPEFIEVIINFLRNKKREDPTKPARSPKVHVDKKEDFDDIVQYFGLTDYILQDSTMHEMRNEINVYKSRENKRLVVQITGVDGSPIHYEGSFKNARPFVDDEIILDFDNIFSSDGFPLSSLDEIEIRLGGFNVQQLNIDDLYISYDDDRTEDIWLLPLINRGPNISGPIVCMDAKIGPLPLGWREEHAVGDDMVLTDFLELVADENNDLTPQTLIINALVFDAKDITGIMSLVEE